uniref:Uncharacterized protein n=1 Tax=Pyxicephalus adspersus TaxID=30357 RepID=A0AAV3AXT3_PYXAD|nr:TPA: hypothetical protein GDO54_008080 [Pyxicephalus adspersus]
MSGKAVTAGRFGDLSRLLAECGTQGAAYGKCVSANATGKSELRRGVCAKEFEELKQCITKAIKKKAR